jgi:peptide-methionine (S)-S-oxide reductase
LPRLDSLSYTSRVDSGSSNSVPEQWITRCFYEIGFARIVHRNFDLRRCQLGCHGRSQGLGNGRRRKYELDREEGGRDVGGRLFLVPGSGLQRPARRRKSSFRLFGRTGKTGHAEVTQISFDPQVISFKELLEVFFTIHDPTTLNRQGADHGTQYRSAVFYHSPEQKDVADKVIADITAAKIWNNPIVTEVTKFDVFYPAEEYHQRYYERNPNQGYCRMVIEPKVIKFRKQFMSKLKKH